MEDSQGYNQDWSEKDMLLFNAIVIEESERPCLWLGNESFCGDCVKFKDVRPHLQNKHGVASDSQLYRCLWDGCDSCPMKRSSLERHVKEQHFPGKWVCPKCMITVSRKRTLNTHVETCKV